MSELTTTWNAPRGGIEAEAAAEQGTELYCWICGEVAEDQSLICTCCRDELMR